MAFCLAFPLAASAECMLTPPLRTTNYPGVSAIPTTNNLVRPTGKSLDAEGQRLTILGRVLDRNCMPIKNALVEIWQPDPFGKWVFPSRAELANPEPVFAAAGRASTGTEGRFSFITLFPGPVKNTAPAIHIRVKAPQMRVFETILFFENDARNADDPVYRQLSQEKREGVTLRMNPLSGQPGYAGLIDLVLPGEEKYVTY
jgi:protocatechuate 3,4-dioxygenase beta subunit